MAWITSGDGGRRPWSFTSPVDFSRDAPSQINQTMKTHNPDVCPQQAMFGELSGRHDLTNGMLKFIRGKSRLSPEKTPHKQLAVYSACVRFTQFAT